MKKKTGYDLDKDMMPIIRGERPPPFFDSMEISRGVAAIAAGGGLIEIPGVNLIKIKAGDHPNWARYFLWTTQSGGLTGEGYVIYWDKGEGKVGYFTLCRHEKVDSPGAAHHRGWHPGYCEKCGLDMTVDSSD